jgi:hypothetical protein
MSEHARRSTADDCPFLHEFMAMDMDERWLNRSPETMLETFHWFRGEGFEHIVEDLLRLAGQRGVIAEGFRLLPHLVKPLVAAPGRALWLLPTPDFRRAAFEGRDSPYAFLEETSDPERALRNLLGRDRMFTDRLRDEVKRLELTAIEVDLATAEGELVARVAEALNLPGL